MNASTTRLGLLAALTLLAACDPRPGDIAQLTGDAARGDELFMAHCKECHGGAAEGTSKGPRIAGIDDAADELAGVIIDGEDEMPAFGTTLDDQQIADVVAWVKGR